MCYNDYSISQHSKLLADFQAFKEENLESLPPYDEQNRAAA